MSRYKYPKGDNKINRKHTKSRTLYQLHQSLNKNQPISIWCFASSMEEADKHFQKLGFKGSYYLVDKEHNKIIILNY